MSEQALVLFKVGELDNNGEPILEETLRKLHDGVFLFYVEEHRCLCWRGPSRRPPPYRLITLPTRVEIHLHKK